MSEGGSTSTNLITISIDEREIVDIFDVHSVARHDDKEPGTIKRKEGCYVKTSDVFSLFQKARIAGKQQMLHDEG